MDEEPHRQRGDDWWLEAFGDLSSCRAFGQIVGPIPWTVRKAYVSRRGWDSGMIDAFHRVMRKLDDVYLKFQGSEMRRETDRQTRRARRGGGKRRRR